MKPSLLISFVTETLGTEKVFGNWLCDEGAIPKVININAIDCMKEVCLYPASMEELKKIKPAFFMKEEKEDGCQRLLKYAFIVKATILYKIGQREYRAFEKHLGDVLTNHGNITLTECKNQKKKFDEYLKSLNGCPCIATSYKEGILFKYIKDENKQDILLVDTTNINNKVMTVGKLMTEVLVPEINKFIKFAKIQVNQTYAGFGYPFDPINELMKAGKITLNQSSDSEISNDTDVKSQSPAEKEKIPIQKKDSDSVIGRGNTTPLIWMDAYEGMNVSVEFNKLMERFYPFIIVIGFTRSGKNSLVKWMEDRYNVKEVISSTTRKLRPGESHGREHWFRTKEQFDIHMNDDKVLAYEKKGEYEYGTTVGDFHAVANEGKSAIYVVNPSGATTARKNLENVKVCNKNILYLEIILNVRYDELRRRAIVAGDNIDVFEKKYKAEIPDYERYIRTGETGDEIMICRNFGDREQKYFTSQIVLRKVNESQRVICLRINQVNDIPVAISTELDTPINSGIMAETNKEIHEYVKMFLAFVSCNADMLTDVNYDGEGIIEPLQC